MPEPGQKDHDRAMAWLKDYLPGEDVEGSSYYISLRKYFKYEAKAERARIIGELREWAQRNKQEHDWVQDYFYLMLKDLLAKLAEIEKEGTP